MCLITFAWHSHPDYPLIVAANRDEFYTRRTRPAAWWGQAVSVLAGRDEEAGGTWFGITRHGRFAALTNVRAPSERNPHAPSRGELVLSALQAPGPDADGDFLRASAHRLTAFNGFNLLVADLAPVASGHRGRLQYVSNRAGDTPRALAPGVYGLSNAGLDTPWPKLTRAVAAFACAIANRVEPEPLLAVLADRTPAPEHLLPATGVPADWERALSPILIRANGYGTRSSTVLLVRNDGVVSFVERTFDADDPERHSDRHFEFTVGSALARPRRAALPGQD